MPMKEDSHLICPISFDEINEAWSSEIGKLIMDRIPLTDVIWKNSTTQTNQVISRLPVRFVPSSSSLFKDTNHPFRWFLAPYVSLYFVSAKNLEEYKAIRSLIATWVELQTQSNGNNKSFWLLVYVVHRDQTPESIREVYSTISNDFLAEKPFDRTVCFQAFGSSETPPQSRLNLSFNDLFAKMRLAISFTFQHRVMIYEREIQRLDTAAGTTAYSFRQAYLVKESLALMFQMMQQPENALLQYIEIERALSLSPRAAYFDTDWPFVNYNSTQSETNRQSSKPPTNNRSSSSAAAAAEGNASSSGIASEYQLKEPLVSKSIGNEVDPTSINVASPREKQRDPWSEVCRQGDEFLSYSINQMRMRVLKTRTSTLELHKYIFARQMFFLLLLSPIRLQDYVEKGCYFVRYMFDQLSKKVLFKHNKSFNQADDSSAEGADLIFLQARWQSNSDINVADISPLLLSIRRKQVDLWFICASVRLIKSFSLIINAPSTKSLVSTKDNDADTTHPGSPQLSVMSHSLLNDVSGLSLSECYRQLSDLSALVCQRASLLCAPLIQNSQLPQPLIASVLSIEFSRQFEKSALDSNQQFTRFPFRHNSFERGRLLSGLISAQFTGWYDGCSEGSLLEFYTKSRAAPLALSRSESALKLSDEQPPILSRSTELLSDDGATRTVTVFGSKDKRKQDFKSLRKFSQLELSEALASFAYRMRTLMQSAWPQLLPFPHASSSALSPPKPMVGRQRSLSSMSVDSQGSEGTSFLVSPLLGEDRALDTLRFLETSSIVSLCRLAMAQHKPALRTHSALNMLLSCGDALLSTGECLGAIDYYVSCLSALDASISGVEGSEFYVPEAVLDQSDSQSVDASFNTSLENPQLSSQDHDKIYVSVLPADTTTSPSIIFRFGKNAFHLFDHKNSQWYLLRYQILRKLLLCAQLADDPKLYCKTALDLLSKDMRRYCEEEDTGSALSVSMVADLNPLCRGHNKHSPRAPAAIPVPSVSPEEVPVSVSWGFTVSFLEYFSYQIIFDDSRFLSSRATIVSDKRKFSVPLIVCDGGEVYDATFELTSALPGYLEVDKIEVDFESVSSVDDEINAVYEFTCSIFPSSAGSSSDSLLTISPSSQLFKIGIRPLVSGVYRMRGLRITMAGIEFYSAISTHNTEFALSVRSPDRNLQTQVLAPSFTPFGCLENLQINISSIDQSCELIVERITLLSSMESKLAAVSLEAPQEHSDLVDVETGSYSKLGRANCFSSSGDSSHINVILDQFGREYINVPFDSRTNKHNQTVCIFFILDNHSDEEARDDRDDTYLLQISSLKTHNIDSKSPEICIHISASINHNGCRLRYGRLLRVPLTVGSGLEISASAVAFNGTEFIEQFLFINSSPVPVYLAGYGMKSRSWACSTDYSNSPIQSIPDSNSINRFIVRTRSEDLPFIGESSGYALTSGLKIGPGEEYFAHFNIFAERSSQNSFIKSSLSDVVFRFYCQKMILSDQNSKQKVAELFAINHPVAVPSERDDCYAPFAFELRISRLLKPINTRISSISVLDLEYTLSVTYTNSALQVNTMFLIEPTEGVNWMITNHYKRFMTLLPAESTKLVLKYARILSIQNDSEIENPPALRVWFNASSTDDSPLTNSNTEFGKSVLVKPVFVDDVCFT